MLFLLPPSETKAIGGGSLNIQQVALTFGALNPARDTVYEALQALCQQPQLAAKVLKLTAKQHDQIAVNQEIQAAPTMRAMDRYAGTLFDAIHGGVTGQDSPLDEAAWLRAKESVLIQSSLFGLIPATDLIPNYRLGASVVLPGASLKRVWPSAHQSVFGRLQRGLFIDLRSRAYAALAPVPEHLEQRWVEVVSRESDGSLRALNHFNKRAKGLLVRAVLQAESPPETISELSAIASSVGLELLDDQSSGRLVLVTDQIKKVAR